MIFLKMAEVFKMAYNQKNLVLCFKLFSVYILDISISRKLVNGTLVSGKIPYRLSQFANFLFIDPGITKDMA